MTKWNLIVDVAGCTNCQACVLACRDEYVGNDFPGYAAEMPKHSKSWIDIKTVERGEHPMTDVSYLPVMCQHCDEAPCMDVAENGAITKRPDGIVIIDPEKAKGQKQLVDACPYGAITWNEDKQVPQHWMFDAHLLDAGWQEPRAAQSCATAAITAIRLSDENMTEMVEQQGLETLHPEYATRPRVWYKNLDRFTKCFIGGSVEATKNGAVDCVAGAAVTLSRDGEKIADTTTDIYGDFKFEGLEPGSGAYAVTVTTSGYAERTLTAELGQSLYLGEIALSP
jgi:Fe-S-cluster-containing dehydrogenase component